MPQDHWLPGFNYNVEAWDAAGMHYETLAICRQLTYARAVFKVAVERSPPAGSRSAAPRSLAAVHAQNAPAELGAREPSEQRDWIQPGGGAGRMERCCLLVHS